MKIAQAKADIQAQAAAKIRAEAQAKAAAEMLAEIEKDRSNWVEDLAKLYLSKLPPPVASVVTDADGKFLAKIPKTGRFVVVATTQRMVMTNTEHYDWLIWASLEGQKSKTILLSNHNLIGTSNPDCLTIPSPPKLR